MVAFRIAMRFLTSRKSQTILIVIGLAIAISVQLFVGILISSLQVGLVDAVTGESPHITIEAADDGAGISNWTAISSEVIGMPHVTGVTASALSYTIVSFGGNNISTGVRGLEMDRAQRMYGLTDVLDTGALPSRTEVIVGAALNKELGADIGDMLGFVQWDGSLLDLRVSGIFSFGNAFADNQVIVDIQTCQAMFDMGYEVDAIEIHVDDVFTADTIASSIEAQLDDPSLKVTNWKDDNADLLSALQSQSLSSYMIQGFVLISVVIAIASVLAITVLQKSKQIGILKAMGIKDRDASLIFLYQGLLLGVMGAIGGILIGLFLLYGFIFGTSSSGQDAVITLIIDYRFIALSAAIAITSAMVASILPARRSSKLSPVEVIRNG